VGTCYGALRLGKAVREVLPKAKIALGGGFVGSQMRDLNEPAVFGFVDYIVLDAGECPLERLIEHLEGRLPATDLHRTWIRENGQVTYRVQEDLADIPHKQLATPTYASLPLDPYFSMTASEPQFSSVDGLALEQTGPRLRLLLEAVCLLRDQPGLHPPLRPGTGRAHRRPHGAARSPERLDRLLPGRRSSTAEAAQGPVAGAARARPVLHLAHRHPLRASVRGEDPELTDLMARAGCICVSGGLETASNRLLALMEKGSTVEQRPPVRAEP